MKISGYTPKPIRLNTAGDYLKLVGMSVSIGLRQCDPRLKSDGIDYAVVENLSDSGTHLILSDVRIKKWLFVKKRFDRHSVLLSDIDIVEVLDRGTAIEGPNLDI